ncbi:MAG: FtsQ-type POTRA domain-containing protein [bacterium]|nr:FtsQ-type POTRA domain-containing protein [bacterium]
MKKENKKNLKNEKKKLSINYRRIFIILIPFIILGSIIWMINYSKTDSYFNIQSIRVSGNKYLTPEEIVFQTEIKNGTNINTIKTDEIMRKLLVNPRVKRAKVIKLYPDQIMIKIEETEQIALFRDSEGINEFSENAVIFPVRKGNTEFNYPIISGVDRNSEEFKLLRWDMVNFIAVLKNSSELFDMVSEIDFSPKHFIKVNLNSGKTALLRKDQYDVDLKRLEILLKSFNIGDQKIIDLRFSNRAFLRESI